MHRSVLPALLLTTTAVLAGCTASAGPSELLSPDAFAADLDATPDGFLLDVRTPQEFQDAHLANATLVPHTALEANEDLLPEDKDTPVFLYCRSGSRSAQAAETLHDMGYTDIRELDGGILAWLGAGLPVVQG